MNFSVLPCYCWACVTDSVCVCACVRERTWVCHTFSIHMTGSLHACAHVCVCEHTFATCVSVHMHRERECVWLCLCVGVCVCLCVCMCVSVRTF